MIHNTLCKTKEQIKALFASEMRCNMVLADFHDIYKGTYFSWDEYSLFFLGFCVLILNKYISYEIKPINSSLNGLNTGKPGLVRCDS